MGNTGSMTSADELNEQYDADGSVTQVPERNDEVHAGESAVAQSRESAVTIPAGTVVLAATPIGNVGDASARLVALLERADIVAAEDTRRLYDLARRLGVYVNGRVIAYHDHNERDKADGLLDQVETGATVLVVSDAGMPTINDPGLAIVRRAIERGLPVTCAPGPSAVLDALALSGLPTDRFCYEGFLPRKHSERVQYLRTLLPERRTIVFYETPHRIADSMDDLLDAFGPNRPMALCRELTKDYEQIRRGPIDEIRQSVIDDPPRGEMVLVIGENIKVRRFARFAENVSVPYVHAGGKIGVLVNLESDLPAEKVEEIGKDVAMQIAALNPRFWDKSQVGQDVLDEEKKIMMVQMENDPKMASKPEAVREKIVMGKLNKFYSENCLLQQEFVKDNSMSVEQYIASAAKAAGGKVTFKDAIRFEKGEGIEKKQENFAEEIASMVKG